MRKRNQPRCVIIAGPNGGGKTTFAREFPLREANIVPFVNADLIAAGLSPLKPELAALAAGNRIEVVYLRLASVRLALRRIAARVRQGGHHVPATDVARRFRRGWENFQYAYRPLADSWAVYDNSGQQLRLIEQST